MSRFRRKMLQGVEPYVPGEQPKGADLVKLNTNENPYPPAPGVFDALRALDTDALRRYSDPLWTDVRAAAAQVFDLTPEHIAVGNGSDELLKMALGAFVDADDTVVYPDVTYSLYDTLVELHGAQVTRVPLTEEMDMPAALADTPGKLLFLCHPNSPTGMGVAPALVDDIVERFPGLVVIDEAYADFADVNYAALAGQRDNVLVLRTVSKAYSLAGMRIGVALGHPEVIRDLETVKDSYNLSVAAQRVAVAALTDQHHKRRNCTHIRETRERMRGRLRGLGVHVYPSQANFVLARLDTPGQARELAAHLRGHGLLVRYFEKPRLEDCLRISVGTDAQVDRLLAATADFLKG